MAAAAKSLQSCPILCNPTDGSPPGSPIPGILQARTLEWGAIYWLTYLRLEVGWEMHILPTHQRQAVQGEKRDQHHEASKDNHLE